MKITLETQYLSLVPFNEIELPQLTLITGLNGSGKSQLLDAIVGGAVKTDLGFSMSGPLSQNPADVAKRTAADFSVDLSPSTDSFTQIQQRMRHAGEADKMFQGLRDRWIGWGMERDISSRQLRALTVELFQYFDPQPGQNGRAEFQNSLDIRKNELYYFLVSLRDSTKFPRLEQPMDPLTDLIRHSSQVTKLPSFLLSRADIEKAQLGQRAFFSSSISGIFSAYQARKVANGLQRIAFEAGDTIEPPLTQEAFLQFYGPAPWDVLNHTMERLGLSSKLKVPHSSEIHGYDPEMQLEDGTRFQLHSLSSGEKIILNLALCGYQTENSNEAIIAPKLLLLDEVDAPLHPAMVRTYLDVINNVLIDQFKMNVIATTHSPTTVALFPAPSIFVMRRGIGGPIPVSQDKAISSLAEGVPTLSVELTSRRQVFAESPVEAANLDQLFKLLRTSMGSPVSLEFIATGTKESNSSRDIVQRIVSELTKHGNRTAYGIIDWDLKNVSDDRVKVMAEGKRYGLENIILDPLIVAFCFLRNHKSAADHFGFKGLDLRSLASLNVADAQTAVDAVTERVLKQPAEKKISSRYDCGLTLEIDEAYFHLDAHKLEAAVATAYPVFEAFINRGSGQLTRHMIENVLQEFPEIIPSEVRVCFLELLR